MAPEEPDDEARESAERERPEGICSPKLQVIQHIEGRAEPCNRRQDYAEGQHELAQAVLAKREPPKKDEPGDQLPREQPPQLPVVSLGFCFGQHPRHDPVSERAV